MISFSRSAASKACLQAPLPFPSPDYRSARFARRFSTFPLLFLVNVRTLMASIRAKIQVLAFLSPIILAVYIKLPGDSHSGTSYSPFCKVNKHKRQSLNSVKRLQKSYLLESWQCCQKNMVTGFVQIFGSKNTRLFPDLFQNKNSLF